MNVRGITDRSIKPRRSDRFPLGMDPKQVRVVLHEMKGVPVAKKTRFQSQVATARQKYELKREEIPVSSKGDIGPYYPLTLLLGLGLCGLLCRSRGHLQSWHQQSAFHPLIPATRPRSPKSKSSLTVAGVLRNGSESQVQKGNSIRRVWRAKQDFRTSWSSRRPGHFNP